MAWTAGSLTRLFLVLFVIIVCLELFGDVEGIGRRSSSRRSYRAASRRTPYRAASRRTTYRAPSTSRRTTYRAPSRTYRASSRRTTRRTSSRRRVAKLPTFRSSVNNRKLSRSSPKSFVTGLLVGGVVVYALSRAPIYGHRYHPYHTSYYVVPNNRALRIKKEEYRVEWSNGQNCTNSKLTENFKEAVVNVNTTVSYDPETGAPALNTQTVSNQKATNVTIKDATDNYIVNMVTRTQYNESISTDPNCTVLVVKTQAYMVDVTSSSLRNVLNWTIALLSLFLSYQFTETI